MKLTINMLPFHMRWLQGAIRKDFVIKHYRNRRVITKFPDMTRIIASQEQEKCRNLFREAVGYALSIIRNAEKKTEWQKKLRKKQGDVYNALIKMYMLEAKSRIEEKKKIKNLTAMLELIKPMPVTGAVVIELGWKGEEYKRPEELKTG